MKRQAEEETKSNINGNNGNYITIVIPLNALNVACLIILIIMVFIGCYYLWKLMTRIKCNCKLCKREYQIEEKLGQGGFGEV
jgi:hypothetical protein